MSVESKVPEIRFEGFSGEWEEKVLEELADIVRGASPRPIEDPKWFDKKSNVGWLRIKDVSEQDGRIYFLEQRISKLGEQKTRVLNNPHLLLSIAASVGKPVINYVRTGVHDGFLIFMKPSFYQEFMFQWMKMFEEEWQKYGQPGSQVNLNSEIVKNQNISIPEPKEQTKIGNYFQQLDTLIAQHQDKHDKLLQIKKSLLEKMFPKQGETKPEIRFKGFSEPWEERELRDICALITKGTTPLDKTGHGSINYIKVENIDPLSGKIILATKISKKEHETYLKRSKLKVNDILFSIAGTLGRVTIVNKDILPANTNQALAIIRLKQENLNYITTYLKGRAIDEYIKKNPTVGAQPNLSLEQIENIILSLPKYEEQTKIGKLFKNLDTLLSQHQSQLKKLKQIKQACLAKMFV